jgi:hypothetical protein
MSREEQLVPRRVLESERDELGQESLQGTTRIAREFDQVKPMQQLPVAIGTGTHFRAREGYDQNQRRRDEEGESEGEQKRSPTS